MSTVKRQTQGVCSLTFNRSKGFFPYLQIQIDLFGWETKANLLGDA